MSEEEIEPVEDAAEEQLDTNAAVEEQEASNEVTEEQLDEVADAAIEALQSVLKYFNAQGAEINEYEGDEDEIILDVVGGDLAVLIGRRGHTLEALQTVVSSITHRKLGYRYPVTIDIESYKHRQRQKIEDIALNAADKAVDQDRSIKLRPMTPYERRIVHIALRGDDRVETVSEGEGRARRVVVSPR